MIKLVLFIRLLVEEEAKYLPLNELPDLAFLDPTSQKMDLIEDAGKQLAQKVSITISPEEIDPLHDERSQYVIESIPIEWKAE